MCSDRGDGQLRPTGFPIRKSPDQSLVADSPGLIAGSNVLHRLLVPRHPPCALINLATTIDARVHCAVLKIRAVPQQTPQHPPRGVTVQEDASRPVPSGPNSVLDHTTTTATLPPPKRRTSWHCRRADQITSAPQRAAIPGHSPGPWLWPRPLAGDTAGAP
jgi:hypothetical protein